jgi:hypothetical protein
MPHSRRMLRLMAQIPGILLKTSVQDSGTRCAFAGWLLYVFTVHKSSILFWLGLTFRLLDEQQPTAFTLSTYTIPEVLEDRALSDALNSYLSAVITHNRQDGVSAVADTALEPDSVLLLRISAAADYFSLDQELMENVPPVLADIILDPFLGNVFPKSLVPTAAWIGIVSCMAVVLARWIATEFASVVSSTGVHEQANGKKVQ